MATGQRKQGESKSGRRESGTVGARHGWLAEAMIVPEPPHSLEATTESPQPPRIQLFINSLNWGQKLLVVIAGLVIGVGTVSAAINGFRRAIPAHTHISTGTENSSSGQRSHPSDNKSPTTIVTSPASPSMVDLE